MEVCQLCAVHEQKRIRIQDLILENVPSGTSDSAGLSYACISGGKRHAIKLMGIQSVGVGYHKCSKGEGQWGVKHILRNTPWLATRPRHGKNAVSNKLMGT